MYMNTKKIIFGNLKSNKSSNQMREWFVDFKDILAKDSKKSVSGEKPFSKIDAVLAPAYPFLHLVNENSTETGLVLGIQDISSYPAGSYTGAISVQNLVGLGVKYTLVGHSERRKYFSETNEIVAKKITQALSADIIPIVCVDEGSLDDLAVKVSAEDMASCMVAYEPSGAIGSGENAALSDVKSFGKKVRTLFGDVPYLYGGSVDESSAAEYLLVTDGVIIGTASLDAKQFVSLLKSAQGEDPVGL